MTQASLNCPSRALGLLSLLAYTSATSVSQRRPAVIWRALIEPLSPQPGRRPLGEVSSP